MNGSPECKYFEFCKQEHTTAEHILHINERNIKQECAFGYEAYSLFGEELAELRRFRDARYRVRESFKHQPGECHCVYCVKDVEGIADLAADYEMRLFILQGKHDALKAACVDLKYGEHDHAKCLICDAQAYDISLLKHKDTCVFVKENL